MIVFPVIVVAFAFHTAITQGNPIETTQDNFDAFLINALEKYPEWLRNNSLDPSPPNQLSFNLSINKEDIQLTCTLTDEQIVGHANQSNLFEITNVSTIAEFDYYYYGIITLRFETRGVVSFRGNYNASGKIDGTGIPLNTNGSWIYTSSIGILEDVKMIFDIFSAEGYVSIWDEYYLHNVYPLGESNGEIYFDGLWDVVEAEYAEVIKESLRDSFLNRLADEETRIPNRELIFPYLREIFNETPLDEIMGWKAF